MHLPLPWEPGVEADPAMCGVGKWARPQLWCCSVYTDAVFPPMGNTFQLRPVLSRLVLLGGSVPVHMADASVAGGLRPSTAAPFVTSQTAYSPV